MKRLLTIATATCLFACSDSESENNANNVANNTQNNGNTQNNDAPCLTEMRIEASRSDGMQLRDLDIEFTFTDDSTETWKCSTAPVTEGIQCMALPLSIIALAPLDDRGEITDVSIADPDGFAYEGPVTFVWRNDPAGCGTIRRGVFQVTLNES